MTPIDSAAAETVPNLPGRRRWLHAGLVLLAVAGTVGSLVAWRASSAEKSEKKPEPEKAFEGYLRQGVEICMGIDKERAKELTAVIKALGVKVQTQIEGEKIKVSSAKKDELQTVIAHLRSLDFPIPLGFGNYR